LLCTIHAELGVTVEDAHVGLAQHAAGEVPAVIEPLTLSA